MHLLYDTIEKEVRHISEQISQTEKQLLQFPQGHISIAGNGPYTKWYQVKPGGRTYISKKNKTLAEQLIYKQYYSAHLHDLKREYQALNAYLDCYSDSSLQTDLLLQNPSYSQFLKNLGDPLNEELSEWAKSPYDQSTDHPDHLRFKSISGNTLRSKSEIFIDQSLFLHHIPYHYEEALSIDGITIYPDFTIRHPSTGKFWYWEHFGMMDSESYVQNVIWKLRLYIANGYIPSINLITTYETQDHPLDMVMVEGMINAYLC